MKNFSKESASRRMRKISDSLPGNGFEGIVDGVKQVSKRQPLLMLGGALITGLLVARMFKSSNGTSGGRKGLSDWDRRGEGDRLLDRDQHSPVSVMPEGDDEPSYTYNAEKSEPYDPHLSDKNPTGSAKGKKNVGNDALDRDRPGSVSVTYEGRRGSVSQAAGQKSAPLGSGSDERQAAGVLDRDQSGPVSVNGEHPSYTHNAGSSESIDPHLSGSTSSDTRKSTLKDDESR